MSAPPGVPEIRTYLAHAGWRPRPELWRGATIWWHEAGHEVLVPARDGMGDAALRVQEVLDVLASVERRRTDEIVHDISSPLMDTQSYRTFPDNLPRGYTTLPGGLRALGGVRGLFDAAARAVVEGPHFAFRGNSPRAVGELLGQVQLGPTQAGSYVLTVQVPVEEPAPQMEGTETEHPPLGRRVLLQMYDAIGAVSGALTQAMSSGGSLVAFDDTVTAGASADLCEALCGLAGPRREQPFEVAFRWAPGLPADVPAAAVAFPEGAGKVIFSAARHLRMLSATGEASVSGWAESLHDDPPGGDRWRVKVRGDLATTRGVGTRRTVWVRLFDQAAYDAAMAAHRARRRVRARGVLSTVNRRVELLIERGGFEVFDR